MLGRGGELGIFLVPNVSSAFMITNAISKVELMMGNVNVILGGGGLGESVMKVTYRFFS